MAEAIAVLGLVSSIASLIDLSTKVVARLREFSSKSTEVPDFLQSLATRLPLLTQALHTLQTHAQTQNLSSGVVSALTTLLNSTSRQVSIVQSHLNELVPTAVTSKWSRKLKALKSISKQKEIVIAVRKIHQDIDVLALHQNTGHSEAHARILRELSQLRLEPRTRTSIGQVGQQFSDITISAGSQAHIGNLYNHTHKHYEAPKPPQLVPRTHKYGLCLGNSPKIDSTLFHGRSTELEKMRSQLESGSGLANRRTLVLGGMGGIGKTQLALRYADRYRESYDSVFWLNASSAATLSLSFRDVAEAVFVSQDFDCFKDEQVVVAVRQWLSDTSNQRWLLIYDNYDEPDAYDITRFYPAGDHGTILVTTRLPQRVKGQEVRVGPLEDLQDSLDILQSRSGRDGIDADIHASALAKRLAGLPLALATAGSYLKTSPWTFQEYLDGYEKRWNVNPRMPAHLPEYKDRTLYTAWDILFTRLQAQQPEVAQLLKLLAYFGNQRLWYHHFEAGTSDDLPLWLRQTATDPFEFENLMNILASQCLVEVQIATQAYSMHAAVHDWTLAVLNQEIEPLFYRYAFDCVRKSIVEDEFDFFQHPSYSAVAEHARRLAYERFTLTTTLMVELEECYSDTYWVAELLRAQVALKSAEQMYIRALAGTETALGPDHPSTLNTVNNLGILYAHQGKLEKTEEMYVRALAGFEKALGPDHTSTLNTVNNLGLLYTSVLFELNSRSRAITFALKSMSEAKDDTSPSTAIASAITD